MTDKTVQLTSKERVAFLKLRAETPDHKEFMRLLDAYLEVLRLSSHVMTHDTAETLVETREKLFEWARPQPRSSDLLRNWATKWAWQIPPAAQGELEALLKLGQREAAETPQPASKESALLVEILQHVKSAAESGDALALGSNAVHNLWMAIQTLGATPETRAPNCERHGQIVETGCPDCERALGRTAQETGAPHTTEDDFAHWLSYSGKGNRATAEQLRDWREAYFAGVEPTQKAGTGQCYLHPESTCPTPCQGGRKCVLEPAKATVRYPGMQICRKYTQNGPCLNEIDHQGECDGLPHL